MSVHISRLRICNFRNFSELDIPLSQSCVLLGENTVGKSNLFHALRLVLDNSLPDSARLLRPEDFHDGLAKPIGQTIEVAVELTGFADDVGAKAILSKYLVSVQPPVARIVYQFRPKQSLEGEAPSGIDEYEFLLFGGLKDRPIDYDFRSYIHFAILPALRDAETELANWRRSPLRRLLEQLSVSSKRLEKITTALDKVSQSLLTVPEIGQLSEDIQERTNEMVGTTQGVETGLALASNDPKQLLRSVKLLIDGVKGRQISEASLGTANVLLLALLLQEMESKIQQKQLVSLILAIEEPEAHLHPHLQRVLFRYFLRRDHAILVSSHSPHIASVAPIKSLVVLTKEGSSGGTKGYAASRLVLDEWEEHDLERYFDVTKAEMAFAKGVVLVEGIAEQFLIPAFARSIRLNSGERVELDRLGISVCAVHGTDFAPYIKLLGKDGLNIPFVVITDGDVTLKKDGTVTYPGLKRAAALLGDGDDIDEAITSGKWKTVRQMVAKEEIFVGSTTLEIEVIEQYSSKAKRAFAELVSEKVAERFSKAVDDLESGDVLTKDAIDKRNEVVTRIEGIGKGRFAQRLSNKLMRSAGPQYIADALNRIVTRVLERTGHA